MTFRADLHTHTSCSDGSMSPLELIEHACAMGLGGLAITDHDTIDAYPEALPAAASRGLKLLSGIEFSTLHRGSSVHLLGYAFDLKNQELQNLCKRHVVRRQERNREILALLKKQGMPIEEEELHQAATAFPHKRVWGRPHIAQAMINRGYVKDFKEAFDRWLGDRRPCYAAGKGVSVEETLEVLHNAGGKGVIAHPHLIRNQALLRQLLEMPFDGIEGYYALFPPWVEARYIQLGKERNWLVTGGSDFHGTSKPHIPLGCSWVDQETFDSLYAHYQNHA